MSIFKDHFSTRSADYAAYRPTYPAALVDYLAEISPGTGAVLDVGCGTGQLSVLLATHFDQVIAIDASAKQIEAAERHPKVDYRVAPAEASGLGPGLVELITVAQAAHWFDLPAFYTEARRVAHPGAVLALITYGVLETDAEIGPTIQHFYKDVVGPFWPPERRHVENGYRDFDFPFDALMAPPLAIEVSWRLTDLTGYADTWSAVREAEKALGRGPIERFGQDLAAVWGDAERRRTIRFPLSLRVGRI